MPILYKFGALKRGIGTLMGFINELFDNLLNTGWLEFIAVITGILSVWYARIENILVYPVGIINVTIYIYLCYSAGLYADMGINAFYLVMSIYGWYNWARKIDNSGHIPISRMNSGEWMFNIAAIMIFYFAIRFVLIRYTNSTVPDLDSLTTSLFIAGMWLMARKKIENWLAWILGDILVIPLFVYKGLAFTGIQYLVFLVLAVMGYIEWSRRLKTAGV